MTKLKNFFAPFGALTIIVPVISVISCGSVDPSDQNDVDQVAAEFKDIQDAKNKKKFFPEWKIGAKVKLEDLGIEEPVDKRGAKISYEILAVNQNGSFVDAMAIIKKNKAVAKVVIDIKKFQDIDEYWNQRFKKLKDDVTTKNIVTSKNQEKASILYNKAQNEHPDQKVSLEEMGVSIESFFKKSDLNNIKIDHDWFEPDDEKGTMQIDIELTLLIRNETWDKDEQKTIIGIPGEIPETVKDLLIHGYKTA